MDTMAFGMMVIKHQQQQGKMVSTLYAMSLNNLFKTLATLDSELEKMESWIQDRATSIQPITNECCGIEENNRMLEQQWILYKTLET